MYISPHENIGVEKKICRLTGEEFVVTDQDMIFYEKFGIPSPTLCPRELWRNLYSYRNEWALFSRICSKTGSQIISQYRPDTIFPVYNHKLWWSDDWSAFDYGRDVDFSKPFFEQYKSLQDVVPRVGTTIFSSENCDFNLHARFCKNCYMCSLVSNSEHVYNSYWNEGKYIFSSAVTRECEYIESCLDCLRCSHCFHCQECRDSDNCFFSFQLNGCHDCIACTNLHKKQYYIYNKPATKDEYIRVLSLLKSQQDMWDKAKVVFEKIRSDSLRPWAQMINTEECAGDHLENCQNCQSSFDGWNGEESRYIHSFNGAKNCAWCYSIGFPSSEQCMLCCVSRQVHNISHCFYCFDSKDLNYSDSCRNSSDLFGCIGVNHGRYAILNKSYSQQEYEILQSKIIDHMKSTGEWGEFFPLQYSPHPYDDTAAADWYPLSQSEVEKRGGRWGGEVTNTEGGKYSTPTTEILHISQYDERIVGVDMAQKNIDHVLGTVFRCSVIGKPFQIIRPELAFHIENGIPLPMTHPRERNRELMKLRNARELHERNCSECGKKIATTYTPERSEKILCEKCFMKYMY